MGVADAMTTEHPTEVGFVLEDKQDDRRPPAGRWRCRLLVCELARRTDDCVR
jgi:hypothetical protein